jgi:hypothetical protein
MKALRSPLRIHHVSAKYAVGSKAEKEIVANRQLIRYRVGHDSKDAPAAFPRGCGCPVARLGGRSDRPEERRSPPAEALDARGVWNDREEKDDEIEDRHQVENDRTNAEANDEAAVGSISQFACGRAS